MDNIDESLNVEATKKPLIEIMEENKSETKDVSSIEDDTRNITETDDVIIDHDRKLLIEKCSVSKSKFKIIEKKMKTITIKEVQIETVESADNDVKSDANDKTETDNNKNANDETLEKQSIDTSVYDTVGVERRRCGNFI